jgi:hypothetical protein
MFEYCVRYLSGGGGAGAAGRVRDILDRQAKTQRDKERGIGQMYARNPSLFSQEPRLV